MSSSFDRVFNVLKRQGIGREGVPDSILSGNNLLQISSFSENNLLYCNYNI